MLVINQVAILTNISRIPSLRKSFRTRSACLSFTAASRLVIKRLSDGIPRLINGRGFLHVESVQGRLGRISEHIPSVTECLPGQAIAAKEFRSSSQGQELESMHKCFELRHDSSRMKLLKILYLRHFFTVISRIVSNVSAEK